MSIFNSEVANLQNESNSIINVFSKTANKLREINSKITKATLDKIKVVESLKLEIGSLNQTHNKNEKVASKIDDFLDN